MCTEDSSINQGRPLLHGIPLLEALVGVNPGTTANPIQTITWCMGNRLLRELVHRVGDSSLRLYSRVVACEIRKIEVYCIDFSRPSPVSKSGGGIH